MHQLEALCYDIGLLKLSQKKIKHWFDQGDTTRLIFAAKKGFFPIRLLCIELMSGMMTDQKVYTQLKSMIDDPVDTVSEAAIALFENDNDQRLKTQIKAARKKRKNKAKIRSKSKRSYPSFIQEGPTRPSDRLMERLRQQQWDNHPPF